MGVITLDGIRGESSGKLPASENLLAVLMEGISKHAIDDSADELVRFQSRISHEIDRLKTTTDARAVVDAVIETVAEHNSGIQADYRAHATELSQAMRMMVETISHVSKSSTAAVHQLGVIEKNLEEVTASTDATKLRSKLGVCLKMIREQSETLQAHTEEHLSYLKSFVASSPVGQQQVAMLEKPLDKVTGLPNRAYAEKLLDERISTKTPCMVGMVSVTRFGGLKGRFGQAVVDALIQSVAQQLAQRLPEATTLCRWSSNSFVAITEIVSSYAEASQQWRKVNGLKVEKHIDDSSRTAMVVLNTTTMVEHLHALSSKRTLVQSLERFADLHSGDSASR